MPFYKCRQADHPALGTYAVIYYIYDLFGLIGVKNGFVLKFKDIAFYDLIRSPERDLYEHPGLYFPSKMLWNGILKRSVHLFVRYLYANGGKFRFLFHSFP